MSRVIADDQRPVSVAVDAWAPEMGGSLPGADDMLAPPDHVDLDIELPLARWEPRAPTAETVAIDDVRFVDGVRRIDARVWLTYPDGTTRLGLCASYAAGTVRSNGRATIEHAEVQRALFAPAGAPGIETSHAFYAPRATGGDDVDALINGLQQRMGALEIDLATQAEPAALTVVDGPLSGRQNVPGAIGYVKTHRQRYLPIDGEAVVARLQPGQRTPLFVTQTSWSRYSWYLRLPHGEGHPWAGVVRCEVSADLPRDQVIHIADQTTATLPRFASRPHRDDRAPQNLVPIGALERTLRHRLGDARLLYRGLRAAAATQAAEASGS